MPMERTDCGPPSHKLQEIAEGRDPVSGRMPLDCRLIIVRPPAMQPALPDTSPDIGAFVDGPMGPHLHACRDVGQALAGNDFVHYATCIYRRTGGRWTRTRRNCIRRNVR